MANPSSVLVTTEAGGTATFLLTLSSQPLADVVVTLTSSNLAEGTVAPTSLTFTAANWNQAQTVTVTGVADGVFEPDVRYSVQLTTASADGTFNQLAARSR